MDGASITRLNVLTWHLYNEYPYATDDPGGILESAERAICRAAAEISGLTPEHFEFSADCINGVEYTLTSFEKEAEEGLRRFAELAKEAD